DARLEGTDGAARGAVLVRAVHGRGVLVPAVAQAVRAGAGGSVGGEDRCDLLGCHHRRKALAVAGMGFCNPRLQAGLCKTLAALPLLAAARPCSHCLTLGKWAEVELSARWPRREFRRSGR